MFWELGSEMMFFCVAFVESAELVETLIELAAQGILECEKHRSPFAIGS